MWYFRIIKQLCGLLEINIIFIAIYSYWILLKNVFYQVHMLFYSLGAFQAVQHVFLVGVGGSVPHVYEFEKHSRLGDIVVSAVARSSGLHSSAMNNHTNHSVSNDVGDSIYIYCDRLIEPPEDAVDMKTPRFVLRKYAARDPTLVSCVEKVLDRFEAAPEKCEWDQILKSALTILGGEDDPIDFARPSPDTDKLKLKVSPKSVF